MIQITPQMLIYVAIVPIDCRKGIDGLTSCCKHVLSRDPFSGILFLFRNRALTCLKVLVYDGQGFWLCTKRLSKGRFSWWPKPAMRLLEWFWRPMSSKLFFGMETRRAVFQKHGEKLEDNMHFLI